MGRPYLSLGMKSLFKYRSGQIKSKKITVTKIFVLESQCICEGEKVGSVFSMKLAFLDLINLYTMSTLPRNGVSCSIRFRILQNKQKR